MEYRSVAILGAGAVGAYLIWGLTKKADVELCVIAEGERRDRFEKEGFLINGELYKPAVKTPEEAHGVDLLVVCVKYNALQGALPAIRAIADENTQVMSLMNGVDSEEVIGAVIGERKVIYSSIKIASERVGNTVKFVPETTIGMVYGEKAGVVTPRIEALDELFAGTGLNYRITTEVLKEIWSKFRLNVPNNQVQAMLSVGVGAYRDSEHVRFLQQAVLAEVDAIAEAKGIHFSDKDKSGNFGAKVQDRARYSTLQDLDARRHTEVDMFSGAVIRMGQEYGIPTPYNEFVYHMIKAIEEKNDGKFDYE